MAIITGAGFPPARFSDAITDLATFSWTPAVTIEELRPPDHLAPFSAAVSADVVHHGDDVGYGRLILLHDPAGRDDWDGYFRCVTYARADVSLETVHDPFLASVGWSWLMDALDSDDAVYREPGGTVTTVASTPFGAKADDDARGEIEIRASWTAQLDDAHRFSAHIGAWQSLLCLIAGIPAEENGVISLHPRLLEHS
ncbi:MAG: DUF3000 domain-containing protein [Propionibacteriaceae bacterium]|nr:DUF3000 domain-containing protein [Propionibacteriaceae bacterium]